MRGEPALSLLTQRRLAGHRGCSPRGCSVLLRCWMLSHAEHRSQTQPMLKYRIPHPAQGSLPVSCWQPPPAWLRSYVPSFRNKA